MYRYSPNPEIVKRRRNLANFGSYTLDSYFKQYYPSTIVLSKKQLKKVSIRGYGYDVKYFIEEKL